MKSYFKKLLCIFCIAMVISVSTSAFATPDISNNLPKVNLLEQKFQNENPFVTKFDKATTNINSVGKNFYVRNGVIKTLDSTATIKSSQLATAQAVYTNSDPYEPNNNSSQATTITYNGNISANISDSVDQDWYALTLYKDQAVAFLLKNIPANCNYDLAVISPDLRVAQSKKLSNANESLYINIDMTGTWRIAVYNTDSTHYSATSNYSLFVGDAWQYGQYGNGWMPTNMTFNFTNSNIGQVLPYQILDLSNSSSIPNSAIVQSVRINHYNIVGNVGNLVKYIHPLQQSGNWYNTDYALDYILNLPDGLYVKQQWAITCSARSFIYPWTSASFSPQILIGYKYLRE